MPETAHPMYAADLLVHGTFTLRRELDRLAHPIRTPGPPRGSARDALVLPGHTLPRNRERGSAWVTAGELSGPTPTASR